MTFIASLSKSFSERKLTCTSALAMFRIHSLRIWFNPRWICNVSSCHSVFPEVSFTSPQLPFSVRPVYQGDVFYVNKQVLIAAHTKYSLKTSLCPCQFFPFISMKKKEMGHEHFLMYSAILYFLGDAAIRPLVVSKCSLWYNISHRRHKCGTYV